MDACISATKEDMKMQFFAYVYAILFFFPTTAWAGIKFKSPL